MKNITYWVEKLNLEPHPEGGFYKEEYRSKERIPHEALPSRFSGERSFSTGIYFLLPHNSFSAFHRIKQDELWHHYYGSPLIIHVIFPDETYSVIKLGTDIEKGERPQAVVHAGCYFAAETTCNDAYTLTGCTVAPGFDFDDFDMPSRKMLTGMFSQHSDIIKKLTR